jgi:hypothetical protein
MWHSEIEKGPLANVSPKAASGSALGGFRGFHTPCSYLVPYCAKSALRCTSIAPLHCFSTAQITRVKPK